MKGYKIYLTRSGEVADIIHAQKVSEMQLNPERIERISTGCTYGCKELPEYLKDTGYEYVLIEYRNLEYPRYDVVFA